MISAIVHFKTVWKRGLFWLKIKGYFFPFLPRKTFYCKNTLRRIQREMDSPGCQRRTTSIYAPKKRIKRVVKMGFFLRKRERLIALIFRSENFASDFHSENDFPSLFNEEFILHIFIRDVRRITLIHVSKFNLKITRNNFLGKNQRYYQQKKSISRIFRDVLLSPEML